MSDNEHIKQIYEAIKEEQKKGNLISRISVVTVVLIFAIFGWGLYSNIQSFDTDGLMKNIETKAQKSIGPKVLDQINDITKNVRPEIEEAFSDGTENMAAKMQTTLKQEQETLDKNLKAYMKEKMTATIKKQLEVQKKEADPGGKKLSEDDDLAGDLAQKLEQHVIDLAQEELDSTFAEHLVILDKMNETVGKLGKQSQVGHKGGKPSTEQLLLIIAEIANSQLNSNCDPCDCSTADNGGK